MRQIIGLLLLLSGIGVCVASLLSLLAGIIEPNSDINPLALAVVIVVLMAGASMVYASVRLTRDQE